MEIIRNTIKLGNSAGVLLPKEWLNSEVKVILQPRNIEREVLEILIQEKVLKNILGLYLVGSYARNEQTIESDIDILAITDTINKKIKKGKYNLICITKKEIELELEKNALPVLAMIREAISIINEDLIKSYYLTELTKKNIKYHIETTKSALEIIKKEIQIAKKMKTKVSDASAYSLILRLRTIYIIECIRNEKKANKKDFLKLVKKISGSLTAYYRYESSKNKNSLSYTLPINEAEKLVDYLGNKIKVY